MTKKIPIILFLFFCGILKAEIAVSGCTIGVTPINFGTYDTFSSNPLDTAGTITVNCTGDVNKANVALGVSSTSGTFNPRRMKRFGGSDLLDYNIYTDVTKTVIFGDGTGGTRDVQVKRQGPPVPWSEIVSTYARIPPGQDVPAGRTPD
jgi:spore coat protein U-like protein